MTELEQAKKQADVKQQAEDSAAGRKKIALQFIIFGLVGVMNTAVDLVVFWLLIKLSVYYVLANVLSYGAGMLNSYLWNNNVTFRRNSKDKANTKKQRASETILRFVIWNGVTLLLSSIIIALLIELAAWSELWSKLVATAIVIVIQFTGMKKWVFRE